MTPTLSTLTVRARAQDPLAPGNQANTIMLDTRKRKGLKPEPAPLNEYEDKL
jgi:elongation factor 2